MAGLTATSPDGRIWTRDVEHDDDGDGFTYHELYAVAADNGERRHLDWSRFKVFFDEHFVAFVAAGFPRRLNLGPWFPEEIEALPEFGNIKLGEAA